MQKELVIYILMNAFKIRALFGYSDFSLSFSESGLKVGYSDDKNLQFLSTKTNQIFAILKCDSIKSYSV